MLEGLKRGDLNNWDVLSRNKSSVGVRLTARGSAEYAMYLCAGAWTSQVLRERVASRTRSAMADTGCTDDTWKPSNGVETAFHGVFST
jgi:hypothetical protein